MYFWFFSCSFYSFQDVPARINIRETWRWWLDNQQAGDVVPYESIFEIELSVLKDECNWECVCDTMMVTIQTQQQQKAIEQKKSNKIATCNVYWVVNGNFYVWNENFYLLYWNDLWCKWNTRMTKYSLLCTYCVIMYYVFEVNAIVRTITKL